MLFCCCVLLSTSSFFTTNVNHFNSRCSLVNLFRKCFAFEDAMSFWVRNSVAASSNFAWRANSKGRSKRVYGLARVDKSRSWRKRSVATTSSKNYSFAKGEDEFKFLEEDPNTSLRVKRFMRRGRIGFEQFLEDTLGYQKQLTMEMHSRVFENLYTIPEKVGPYKYYQTYKNPDDNFPTFCRQKVSDTEVSGNVQGVFRGEQIVLNVNTVGEDNMTEEEIDYVHIGSMKVSLDHAFLAFTMATAADENFALCIRDVDNDKTYLNVIDGITSCEWTVQKHAENDSASDDERTYGIYYTKSNALGRPHQVWRQLVCLSKNGCSLRGKGELYFEESDEQFFVELQRTKDGKYVTISSNSKTTSEVWVTSTNVDDNPSTLKCILRRQEGKEYYIDHVEDFFYIIHTICNRYAVSIMHDYDFFDEEYDESTQSKWEDVNIHLYDDTEIEDIDVMKDHCGLFERKHGKPQIRIFKHGDPNIIDTIPLPSEIGSILPGMNQDYHGDNLRVTMSSPLMPETVMDYDVHGKNITILQNTAVSGKPTFDPADYLIYQSWAKSKHDGEAIPITLIHSKCIEQDSTNPLLLHGYGAYGTNVEVDFQADILSLLSRKWIVAYAHVRGGSELGRRWYADGKGLNKTNTFHDFAACAEHLIEQRWTDSNLICGHGMSAGGLMLGAVANMYPGLFKAMIMKVPFTDPYSSMCDPTLPLTIHEYDEWGGNPLVDSQVRDYILSYSPYQNIVEQAYPSMLITGSTIDNRVPAWQPMKYFAKIKEYNTDKSAAILLSMQDEYGHFGQGGRYGHLQESVLEYAFLTKVLGLEYS